MIRYACPRCKAVLESPDQEAGHKVACPGCGQRLQIPLPPRTKTILASPVPVPPSAPGTPQPPPAVNYPSAIPAPQYPTPMKKSIMPKTALCVGCGREVGETDTIPCNERVGDTRGMIGRYYVSLTHTRPGRLCLRCLAARVLVAPLALLLALTLCAGVYVCLLGAGAVCRWLGLH